MIRIRPMTPDDLPLGLRLSRDAGWNQTPADWSRLLDLAAGVAFVAELDGVPVGTTTACDFGPIAWVAMVLVDPDARGRGVGTALVTHAVEAFDALGVLSIRLDATPLGEPLYRRLGFVAEYPLTRFQGEPDGIEEATGASPLDSRRINELLILDCLVTKTVRYRLLARLLDEDPGETRIHASEGVLDGYLMSRPGAFATQIGPCIGRPRAGAALLAEALARHRGRPVVVDIPAANEGARQIVQAAGLAPRRELMRMVRGFPIEDDPGSIWASSGPEMG